MASRRLGQTQKTLSKGRREILRLSNQPPSLAVPCHSHESCSGKKLDDVCILRHVSCYPLASGDALLWDKTVQKTRGKKLPSLEKAPFDEARSKTSKKSQTVE